MAVADQVSVEIVDVDLAVTWDRGEVLVRFLDRGIARNQGRVRHLLDQE